MVLIKVEDIEVWGFEHAIRGMRNPLNSWEKSDSYDAVDCGKCGLIEEKGFCKKEDRLGRCDNFRCYEVGKNDLDLMKRLFKAGTEHRKYLRQIFVSMDIVAPLYWWKEYDTYKVGTVANSCSTMHKLTAKPFETSDFSYDKLGLESTAILQTTINQLNKYRLDYLNSKEKFFWWQIIQLLPSSYNQRRTVTMNYENVFAIIKQRSGHKLDEWNEFVKILKRLPYVKDIAGYEE
jgi:hypothetical protein